MMDLLYRRIYHLLLRLHPVTFREGFARDMALDFEEALPTYGPTRLLVDVVGSLVRQWSGVILNDAPEPIVAQRPSLLAGNYVMVCDQSLTPLELALGLMVSATKFALFLVALSLSLGPLAGLPMVYAASDADAMRVDGDQKAASQAVAVNGAAQSKDSGELLHGSGVRPSFELASIRPSGPHAEARFSGITMHASGIEIKGLSVKDVIEFAYDVRNEDEFSGGPSWMRTEMFDVTAKPSEAEAVALRTLSPNDQHRQMQLMLQSLLEERFHLKARFPMKKLSFFALSVAKGGFKCIHAAPNGEIGPPPPPPPPAGREPGQLMHWAPRDLDFAQIAKWVAEQPELGGRVVEDRTGLSGVFDCDVSWAAEGMDVAGPSIFTAIQEQMGLKLRAERGPVETIVIEDVERPTAN